MAALPPDAAGVSDLAAGVRDKAADAVGAARNDLAATFGFLFILHYYLLHAGGGLVIVPEGDGLGIYNFRSSSTWRIRTC